MTLTPALQKAFDKAKARTKEIAARPDRYVYDDSIDWGDIGKSALTGTRSGLESTVGGLGDIGALQKQASLWLADKAGISARAASPHAVEHERSDTGERAGLSPEAMDFITSITNPLSAAPTSEDVGAATDQMFGRDDYTRHVATSRQGRNIETAANLASGIVGDLREPQSPGELQGGRDHVRGRHGGLDAEVFDQVLGAADEAGG